MNEASVLEGALATARVNARVCPQPKHWQALYELLVGGDHSAARQQPSAPLILAAWHFTSDAEKAQRFHEHIRWAAEHGAIGPFVDAIRLLEEHQWHHKDE